MSNPSYILEAYLPGAAEPVAILIDRKRYDLLCTDFIKRISLAGVEYEITMKTLAVNYSTITPAIIIRVKLKAYEEQPATIAPFDRPRPNAVRAVPGEGLGKRASGVPDLAA